MVPLDVLRLTLVVGILIEIWSESVAGQNCGCPKDLCCSRFGYCGSTDDYCGSGCRQGPCNNETGSGSDTHVSALAPTPHPSYLDQNCGCSPTLCCSHFNYCGANNDDLCGLECQPGPCGSTASSIDIAHIVTPKFFNGIKNQSDSGCFGQDFYSRGAFLDAIKVFPRFGLVGTSDDSKREIAAFFAHVTHETGRFCYIEEINGASWDYCQESKQYPCAPGKKYFGRGPIQITWNFNYGAAGKSIGVDLLKNPELVAKDPAIAFKTAFWFWMNNVHSIITSGKGFGPTIRAINGGECNGGVPEAVRARVNYYQKYCKQLGVTPGSNLSC